MDDIRKDPVTLGYDYYGTVVNTAARVEGVAHGGQILVTDDAFRALSDGFLRKNEAVAIALGPQPLRGLDEPLRLHQLLPETLSGRRFPPLLLHIEKETEEDADLTTESADDSSVQTATPEELISRVCSSKQYQNSVAYDALALQYYFFLASFAPAKGPKMMASVITKLAEVWGIQKESSSLSKHIATDENKRARLLVTVLAKIVKTFSASRKVKGNRPRGSQASYFGATTMTNTAYADSARHSEYRNLFPLPNQQQPQQRLSVNRKAVSVSGNASGVAGFSGGVVDPTTFSPTSGFGSAGPSARSDNSHRVSTLLPKVNSDVHMSDSGGGGGVQPIGNVSAFEAAKSAPVAAAANPTNASVEHQKDVFLMGGGGEADPKPRFSS